MKLTTNKLIRLVFLITLFAWINCSDGKNPLTPSGLSGTYTLVSITDKANNFTLNAGDIFDLDGGGPLPEGFITGTFESTETRFTFTFIIQSPVAGPTSLTASGTYTISGSRIVMTITNSDIPGTLPATLPTTNILGINLNGNRLTLEDEESRFIFDKK